MREPKREGWGGAEEVGKGKGREEEGRGLEGREEKGKEGTLYIGVLTKCSTEARNIIQASHVDGRCPNISASICRLSRCTPIGS